MGRWIGIRAAGTLTGASIWCAGAARLAPGVTICEWPGQAPWLLCLSVISSVKVGVLSVYTSRKCNKKNVKRYLEIDDYLWLSLSFGGKLY